MAFARRAPVLPVDRPPAARRPAAALAVTVAVLGLLLLTLTLAGVAQAKVVEVEGLKVGLQERSTSLGATSESMAAFANPEGHPVLAGSSVYAIYWDPDSLYAYHGDWEHLIDGFLHNVSTSSGNWNVFAVDGQYSDAAGGHADYDTSFKGAYTDTDPYPATPGCQDPAPLEEPDAVTCVTDGQIRTELTHFVSENSLPRGMGTVYYLLTPPGVTTCLDAGGAEGHCSDYDGPSPESYENSFCSYHSYIEGELPNGGPNTILYAVIPWSAGGLGDHELLENDRTPAFECQDGGWDPSGPGGLEWELEKETAESLHQQEPNQLAEGTRSDDGSFDTGLADLIINQVAVEQQDIVTDPLLNAWQDEMTGNEAVDECRDDFALTLGGSVTEAKNTAAGTLYNQEIEGAHYYLNDAFNLANFKQGYPGIPCRPGIRLEPQFTAPAVVNAGETVGFNGHESDITLDAGVGYDAESKPYPTYPTYSWSFGDGTEKSSDAPAGANPSDEPSAFHTYAYGGTYEVTLKVTDTGGNVRESAPVRVTVAGPPPPVSTPSTGGAGSSGAAQPGGVTAGHKEGSHSSGGSQGDKRGGNSAGKLDTRPVLTAVVLTTSLKKALARGLTVRYSVDQQVAGSLEVMLPSKLARRLHIHARKAKSLPKGTPPERVIAGRPLVTMGKAHGRLLIGFKPSIAKHLRHLHHLRLTLRLAVHNASLTDPKVARLQTVAKLHR